MVKWILAAVGVVVLSLAISAWHMHLSSSPRPYRYDAAAFERDRQIQMQYHPVSLVALLADPERYDGRKVLVSGFVTLGFEGSGLHLDKSAYEAGLRRNAVWLEKPKWLSAEAARRLDRRYGDVAGTFDASGHGHVGAYTGALVQVRRIRPTFTQSNYQQWRRREQDDLLMQTLFSGWFLIFVGSCGLGLIWLVTRRRA